MKAIKSLNDIIQNISGHGDAETVQILCNTIQENGYCNGVACDDCPFNSTDQLDELAINLDNSKVTLANKQAI